MSYKPHLRNLVRSRLFRVFAIVYMLIAVFAVVLTYIGGVKGQRVIRELDKQFLDIRVGTLEVRLNYLDTLVESIKEIQEEDPQRIKDVLSFLKQIESEYEQDGQSVSLNRPGNSGDPLV